MLHSCLFHSATLRDRVRIHTLQRSRRWMMEKYHAIHGHDIASFDTSDTHRLPTVSASQALDELRDGRSNHIPTGLDDLDRVLLNSTTIEDRDAVGQGGVKRGQVTEIWGPPGTGKTALGIQLAANALCGGDAVVWVDCFQTVQTQRITNAVNKVRGMQGKDAEKNSDGFEDHFHHYSCLTLPHFIALISRPTMKSIPTTTSLIVVSSLSALINSTLPKAQDGKAASKPKKGPSSSAKRLQALQSIMNALQKLAATRSCAVVVLAQCATKMHSERGATLTPAVNATVWEQGVSTRLVLFRDWVWQGNEMSSAILAGLQKLDGRVTPDAVEKVVAFRVESDGITKVDYDVTQSSMDVSTLPHHKRKLGQTDLEIPDSEDDEDYGWAEEDEAALPAPPPQWQGSEDLLLGRDVGRSEDEESEGEGDEEGEAQD